MKRELDFYFFIGSTYSYLSVNRATRLAAEFGVTLHWRPFSLRTLLREQGNSPFIGKPSKLSYMWRDLERRAYKFDIPFAGPPPYPTDPESRAGHMATLAEMEGWCEPFVREAYRSWFLDKKDPGEPATLAAIVAKLGRSADCLERSGRPDVLERYVENTNTARTLGIFGSPTFVYADQELFWGDDRLEEALACAVARDRDA